MKRRRGRPRAIHSRGVETAASPATWPEAGLRRAKRRRSSSSNDNDNHNDHHHHSDDQQDSALNKKTRTQPTEPLHMTTRAASRAATNSTANSVASADSRRNSLHEAKLDAEAEADADAAGARSQGDDEDEDDRELLNGKREESSVTASASALVGGLDVDAERPAKRSRLSDRSNPSTNNNARSGGTPASARKTSLKAILARNKSPESRDHLDVVSKLPSTTSSRSAAKAAARLLSPVPSDDASSSFGPALQRNDSQGSMVEEPDHVPDRSAPRRRGGRGGRRKSANYRLPLDVVNGNDTPISGTPARDAAVGNGVENNNELEPTAKTAKRMPGRRRAPNPNLSIEADLRRQLTLKTGYRAVVKALKPILIELAQRSVDELTQDETAHKNCKEYDAVMSDLNDLLACRLQLLETERTLNVTYQEQLRKRSEEYLHQQFESTINDLQDEYMIKTKNRLLNLARRNEREEDPEVTDDEFGDVILPRFGAWHSCNPMGPLPEAYDSRSRRLVVTERKWDERQSRLRIAAALAQFLTDHDPDAAKDAKVEFALADPARRECAVAGENLYALLDAATSLDEQQVQLQIEIVPNEAAEGLLLLAAASELVIDHGRGMEVPRRGFTAEDVKSRPPEEAPSLQSRPEVSEHRDERISEHKKADEWHSRPASQPSRRFSIDSQDSVLGQYHDLSPIEEDRNGTGSVNSNGKRLSRSTEPAIQETSAWLTYPDAEPTGERSNVSLDLEESDDGLLAKEHSTKESGTPAKRKKSRTYQPTNAPIQDVFSDLEALVNEPTEGAVPKSSSSKKKVSLGEYMKEIAPKKRKSAPSVPFPAAQNEHKVGSKSRSGTEIEADRSPPRRASFTAAHYDPSLDVPRFNPQGESAQAEELLPSRRAHIPAEHIPASSRNPWRADVPTKAPHRANSPETGYLRPVAALRRQSTPLTSSDVASPGPRTRFSFDGNSESRSSLPPPNPDYGYRNLAPRPGTSSQFDVPETLPRGVSREDWLLEEQLHEQRRREKLHKEHATDIHQQIQMIKARHAAKTHGEGSNKRRRSGDSPPGSPHKRHAPEPSPITPWPSGPAGYTNRPQPDWNVRPRGSAYPEMPTRDERGYLPPFSGPSRDRHPEPLSIPPRPSVPEYGRRPSRGSPQSYGFPPQHGSTSASPYGYPPHPSPPATSPSQSYHPRRPMPSPSQGYPKAPYSHATAPLTYSGHGPGPRPPGRSYSGPYPAPPPPTPPTADPLTGYRYGQPPSAGYSPHAPSSAASSYSGFPPAQPHPGYGPAHHGPTPPAYSGSPPGPSPTGPGPSNASNLSPPMYPPYNSNAPGYPQNPALAGYPPLRPNTRDTNPSYTGAYFGGRAIQPAPGGAGPPHTRHPPHPPAFQQINPQSPKDGSIPRGRGGARIKGQRGGVGDVFLLYQHPADSAPGASGPGGLRDNQRWDNWNRDERTAQADHRMHNAELPGSAPGSVGRKTPGTPFGEGNTPKSEHRGDRTPVGEGEMPRGH